MGKMRDALEAAGYSFEEGHLYRTVGNAEVRFLSISKDGMKLGEIDMTGRPVSFACGIDTTCIDLVSDYYDLDEDADCTLRRGYGKRTAAYLDAVSSRIGLRRVVEDDTPAGGDEADVLVLNNGRERVRLLSDGAAWIAETRRDGAESSTFTKMEFAGEPSASDIYTALDVLRAHRIFSGRPDRIGGAHWLDADGSISDKIAAYASMTEE